MNNEEDSDIVRQNVETALAALKTFGTCALTRGDVGWLEQILAERTPYRSDDNGYSGAWGQVAEQLKQHNPDAFLVGRSGIECGLQEIRRLQGLDHKPPQPPRREYHVKGMYWSGVPTVDLPCAILPHGELARLLREHCRDRGECVYCRGNDRDLPCLYPGEGKHGCLADARLKCPP